jgi:hypothetical protein
MVRGALATIEALVIVVAQRAERLGASTHPALIAF